jgi:rhodanese-related sulfurtransferase
MSTVTSMTAQSPAGSTLAGSVTAETVLAWLAADEAVLIDVREPDEYADEYIPGSVLLPLSTLEATALPAVPGKRRILQCLTGKRSAIALARLAENGIDDLLHLDGGLLAWKIAGGKTIEADEPVAA